MHTLKKIYCRAFQTAFRVAIPYLPYRQPRILGSVKAIPEVLEKKKCSSVLIITDSELSRLGITKRLS